MRHARGARWRFQNRGHPNEPRPAMGVQTDDDVIDDDQQTVDTEDDAEDQQQADAPADGADSEGGAADTAAAAEPDEVVVAIGDETPEGEDDDSDPDGKPAAQWVKDLRKSSREKDRAIRERDRALKEKEAEIARLKGATQPGAAVVGDEPTLASCDYDEAKFKADWKAWNDRRAAAEAEAENRRKAQEKAQSDWQARLDAYGVQKKASKVRDIDECEAVVQNALSVVQQGIIISGAENAALIVAALGKNPVKLKELAGIADPVKFAVEIGKLETKLKVIPRRAAPPPDTRVGSTVAGAAALNDNELARLQAEADKTGDRSKVAAYIRKKQQAAQQRR
jgi:hypothetical protein